MTQREAMVKFIAERLGDSSDNTVPKIQQVLHIGIKDSDDDNGPIGKHYVVKCLMIRWKITGTVPKSGVYEQFEATCLVNRHIFDKYMINENALIWI